VIQQRVVFFEACAELFPEEPAALGAMSALRAAGRRIPDDVAVVGFDDSPMARSADPPLTTVRQPVELLGGELIRLLLQMISSGDWTPSTGSSAPSWSSAPARTRPPAATSNSRARIRPAAPTTPCSLAYLMI
jgi:hypothetical protein